MGIVIGIDEAGLGPNLGPFVVTATVWDVPDPATAFDFWSALSTVVSSDSQCVDGRTIVADSKALFQPHQGVLRLERSVLALLGAAGIAADSLQELCRFFHPDDDSWTTTPWLQDVDLKLPCEADHNELRRHVDRLRMASAKLRRVDSRVVSPAEFNRLLDGGNKSEVVTRCHLELLRRVCRDIPTEPVLVLSDKHGGRNRYAAALASHWDGDWVSTDRESAEQSIYRIGKTEFRFEPRAERYLPVAAASMVSKYLRELHMRLFNEFWQGHVPGLAPTQGYPVDARRFADAIEFARAELQIPHAVLWRHK